MQIEQMKSGSRKSIAMKTRSHPQHFALPKQNIIILIATRFFLE